MRKSKFTEEQIIAILAEQERGMATEEVCRRHGVSETLPNSPSRGAGIFGSRSRAYARQSEPQLTQAPEHFSARTDQTQTP